VKTFKQLSVSVQVSVLILPWRLVSGFEMAILSMQRADLSERQKSWPSIARVQSRRKAEDEDEDDWGTRRMGD
jgi:hypothetical protein